MTATRNLRIRRTIPLLIAFCLVSSSAQAQYSGGSGTAEDPYQIATAEDLMLLGETPEDHDKHFILTADIDLDPNLPGRKVFDGAVIAPDTPDARFWEFDGVVFTGAFDGNNHTISHLTITGDSYLGLFGELGYGATVSNLGLEAVFVSGNGNKIGGLIGSIGGFAREGGSLTNCYSTGSVTGRQKVGGLAGWNVGSITMSYSTGKVSGYHQVGGVVGANHVSITSSYSTGAVRGGVSVGGFVGDNGGNINNCYSTGAVTGDLSVGGLVGDNDRGSITASYSAGAVAGNSGVGGLVGIEGEHGSIITSSFWDIETSGQATGDGGTGATTAEMHSLSTYLNAGWDFAGESANGSEDIWWIAGSHDYPRLWWQYGQAFNPIPADGATDISPLVIFEWISGGPAMHHDIYLGQDRDQVTFATPKTTGVYSKRQTTGETSYDPGTLDWDKTYYWRIDEIDEVDSNSPWKGDVWSFTTADYVVVLVVDDFESYTEDVDNREMIFQIWIDGKGFSLSEPGNPGNGTGSFVGHDIDSLYDQSMEIQIVHSGAHSMPYYYYNDEGPYYSEAERTWKTPQDWTIDDADTLTLYFRGALDNTPDPLYVAVEDSAGHMAAATHPDTDASLATEWQKWHIRLAHLQANGVNVASVKKMIIGVGDSDNLRPGGTGLIYIDDICVTNLMR